MKNYINIIEYGLGIENMKFRAMQIGGELKVSSGQNGTIISLSLRD